VSELLVEPQKFLAFALTQEGKPYLWGAKGPSAYDCSGLVTWCLRNAGGPDWRLTHNSQKLFDTFEPAHLAPDALRPEPLLAFYGRDVESVTHVMIALGDGRTFGACGGGSSTTSIAIAVRKRAAVKFRSRVRYRTPDDFLGFRRLAFPSLPPTPGASHG
jgi:murein DD-endopeptidase